VCNVVMASEPLAGRRLTKATESRTKVQWSHFVQDIALAYPDAQQITLVMDNLNTHTAAALYETFPPSQAKALWDRFEFVYTDEIWNAGECHVGPHSAELASADTGSREGDAPFQVGASSETFRFGPRSGGQISSCIAVTKPTQSG
jgi:DDE superfamily endonuclease